jgi:L-fuconolactonase
MEVVMIRFPIIDTHLHLWDITHLDYPWLKDVPYINRSVTLADYNAACGPVKVEKMVFMQCECKPSQYTQEVAWISELAKKDKRLQGIVSWAPLEKGEAVRSEIKALKKNPLVKGIRRIIQFEDDLKFCLRPDFIAGVRLLAEYGLTFDICIDHRHTANTIRLVEQCPDVRFMLDHIGKPDIKGKRTEPWKSEIKELSAFSHVYCKVSSLATEADHERWTLDDIAPFVEHIFDCFGTERTVWAGDWPVSSQAAAIPVCVETTEHFLRGVGEEEKRRVFYDNALSFYRL